MNEEARSWHEFLSGSTEYDAISKELRQIVHMTKPTRLLDIGSGNGYPFAGIDLSETEYWAFEPNRYLAMELCGWIKAKSSKILCRKFNSSLVLDQRFDIVVICHSLYYLNVARTLQVVSSITDTIVIFHRKSLAHKIITEVDGWKKEWLVTKQDLAGTVHGKDYTGIYILMTRKKRVPKLEANDIT